MSATRKNVGQAAPDGNTLTDAYTVAVTSSVVGLVMCANRSDYPAKVSISHAVAGAADEVKQYLVYEHVIPPHLEFPFAREIFMLITDVLRVKSDTGNVSFNVYAEERS